MTRFINMGWSGSLTMVALYPWVLKIGRNRNPTYPAAQVLNQISVLWMTAGDSRAVYVHMYAIVG